MERKVELLIGTSNKGKLYEISSLLKQFSIKILSFDDLDKKYEINESGSTFLENAFIKAEILSKKTGYITMADDSGLVVPILNGEPGIYSARYASTSASDNENNEKLIKKIKLLNLESTPGYFLAAIAVVKPNGQRIYSEGRLSGEILTIPKGSFGFGYDPLFFIPELSCTMAELTIVKKSEISHRGKALKNIIPQLPSFLGIK